MGYIDPSIIIYGYTPSIALASLAAIWFFIHLVIQTTQTLRLRTCWWWLVFSVGLIFEVIGYIARSLSAKKNPYILVYFVLNYFFIVTAPVFFGCGDIYDSLDSDTEYW